ncbi:hypothetical protein LSG31_00650 [Fodinisporobacter ferrooxydans]|uniref:Uncharacterized protein n=1 Tax=Fodinisporobacter ferrooxydans TaxID=2901836 RepID=A0ABY4CJY6_9BACL|nr:hypothetical protein LSG31_00650 [Alicyclobacillaceae bacterium MYW30-H2]
MSYADKKSLSMDKIDKLPFEKPICLHSTMDNVVNAMTAICVACNQETKERNTELTAEGLVCLDCIEQYKECDNCRELHHFEQVNEGIAGKYCVNCWDECKTPEDARNEYYSYTEGRY